MSYSFRGSHYHCHLTGKNFTFRRTPDGKEQRRALAELLTAQQSVRDAANQRAQAELGRPATEREIRFGFDPPDHRSTAERVNAEVVHIRQPTVDPNRNPFAKPIADLQALRPPLAGDRLRLEKRIAVLQQQHDEWEVQRAADRQREAILNSPDVQAAISDGRALITLLSPRGDVPQSWLNQARQRLADLERGTLDPKAYWASVEAFEAEREQHKAAKLAELEEQKQTVESQIDAVRHDRPEETTDREEPAGE